MTLHQCECCTKATTRAELESRHGTPANFRRAVENAVGKWISWSEADAAIEVYQRRWDAAPAGIVANAICNATAEIPYAESGGLVHAHEDGTATFVLETEHEGPLDDLAFDNPNVPMAVAEPEHPRWLVTVRLLEHGEEAPQGTIVDDDTDV